MTVRLRRREAPEAEMPGVDAVLKMCPACKAWPMAANISKPSWGYRPVLLFTCPRCRFTLEAKRGESPQG
jgi:hypothetical protein